MTLLQLKYFCTACELYSITKAAEKLFVTQPTVSTAIRELEQEFQIRLLNRRSKGMALTDEGMAFYREACALLQRVNDFENKIRFMAEQKRYIRLGLTKASGASVYQEYFAFGVEHHPELNIVVRFGASEELLPRLRDGKLDVIIVPRQEEDEMDEFRKAELCRMGMWYCVSAAHPLAKEKELDVSMVLHEKMVSTLNDNNKMKVMERLFEPYGVKPAVIQRYEQISMALSMIQANVATGYFPEGAVRNYSGIVGKPLREEPLVPIYLVWTDEGWRREEVRTLIHYIRKFYMDR